MSSYSSLRKRRKRRLPLGMAKMNERIRTLRERAAVSQGAFGKFFGVTREAVSQWESGKSRPDQTKLQAMAAKYEVTLDWLSGKADAPTLVKSAQKQPFASETSGRVSFVPGGERLFQGPEDLPILGHVKAGESGFFIDQGEVQGMTTRLKALEGVVGAYAVRVNDDSMFPAYEPDDLVQVNPHLRPMPGQNVVIQLVTGEALIKRLVRRTDKEVRCEQWNPKKEISYDPKQIRAIHRIVRPV